MSPTNHPHHSIPTLQPSPNRPSPPVCDLTGTAMQDFRELFSMFDTNHNGTIEFSEFKHILHMLGDDSLTGSKLETMLRIACETSVTIPLPRALTFDQFMRFFAIYKQDWSTHVTDAHVFSVLDRHGSGTVPVPELGKLLARFGMHVSDDEVNAMADFATPLPRANDIYTADMVHVAERVRRLRETCVATDASDTSEDDVMTRV